MEPRPTLSALTPEELLQRSREYRRMATSATSAEVRDGLNRLAVRFALLAATSRGIVQRLNTTDSSTASSLSENETLTGQHATSSRIAFFGAGLRMGAKDIDYVPRP
jgi:hypothetical protein